MAGVLRSRVIVSDEGTEQGQARVINFVGAGVVANPNVGDASQMDVTIPGGAGTPTAQQSAEAKLALDASTISAVLAPLVSLAIVTGAGGASRLLLWVCISVECSTSAANVIFDVQVDDVSQEGAQIRVPANNQPNSCAIMFRTAILAPGAHTIRLRWSTSSGTVSCFAATKPLLEHAMITALEVTV